MKRYECASLEDCNTRLLIETETEHKIGDIYIDEHKDENHHFIYGKYVVIEKRS